MSSSKRTFQKRSLHYVQVTPTQVVPMMLHLHDRKAYTQENFSALIRGLGKHLQPKLQPNPFGGKQFPTNYKEKHATIQSAVLFTTEGMRYSYYFQTAFPEQTMLVPIGVSLAETAFTH